MAAARKTRVLIVDDYQTVRADLRTMLELVEGVQVVGECASSLVALRQPDNPQPDVILIDLDVDRRRSPGSDGMSVIRTVKTRWPEAAIYVLSAADTQSVLPAGVSAAFVKGMDTERLLDCIRNFRSESERKVEMEATRERALKVAEQARAVALPQAKAGSRLAYIDTLRMVLIILVIMVHAAVTYGSLGDWTYEDPSTDETSAIILSFFVKDSQGKLVFSGRFILIQHFHFFLQGGDFQRSRAAAEHKPEKFFKLFVNFLNAFTEFHIKLFFQFF